MDPGGPKDTDPMDADPECLCQRKRGWLQEEEFSAEEKGSQCRMKRNGDASATGRGFEIPS